MADKKEKKKRVPNDVAAANRIAAMCRDMDDFDCAWKLVLEDIRPLALKKWTEIRFSENVLKPTINGLRGETMARKAECIVGAIVENPTTIPLLVQLQKEWNATMEGAEEVLRGDAPGMYVTNESPEKEDTQEPAGDSDSPIPDGVPDNYPYPSVRTESSTQ